MRKIIVGVQVSMDGVMQAPGGPTAGEIRIGDTALDSPSDREVARRTRMRREG